MNTFLLESTPHAAAFLAGLLPPLGADWWRSRVIEQLTAPQQRNVGERGYARLEQLDLAALLRVLERNWRDISARTAAPFEDLTYIREMGNLRNRWAHMNSVAPPAIDMFRDFDTLHRFLRIVGAPEGLRARVAIRRDAVLGQFPVTPGPVVSVSPSAPVRAGGHVAPIAQHGGLGGTQIRRPQDESAAGELLRSVGMACFVNCFEDFEREVTGRCGRDATKNAMFNRGGAATDNAAATKAAVGVRIIRDGLAAAALAAVSGSSRMSPEVRARANEFLVRLRANGEKT